MAGTLTAEAPHPARGIGGDRLQKDLRDRSDVRALPAILWFADDSQGTIGLRLILLRRFDRGGTSAGHRVELHQRPSHRGRFVAFDAPPGP